MLAELGSSWTPEGGAVCLIQPLVIRHPEKSSCYGTWRCLFAAMSTLHMRRETHEQWLTRSRGSVVVVELTLAPRSVQYMDIDLVATSGLQQLFLDIETKQVMLLIFATETRVGLLHVYISRSGGKQRRYSLQQSAAMLVSLAGGKPRMLATGHLKLLPGGSMLPCHLFLT